MTTADSHAHVDRQEEVQREQFDAWANTKAEVDRVQAIAEGRAVPVKTSKHHAAHR